MAQQARKTAARKTAAKKTAAQKTAAKRSSPVQHKPAARPGRSKPAPAQNAAAGRPVWNGTLSFGLIAIPIALAPAVREAAGKVSFNLLDKRDGARLRRRWFCPAHERLVPDEEVVRGAEVAPGKWVAVDDDELRAAEPKRSEALEIELFVPAAEIDPRYYDRPYFVTPQGGAKKPFRLLQEALAAEDTAGIARFVLHGREHVVALRASGELLQLHTLRFSSEIRAAEGLAPQASAERQAVNALRAAIDALRADFDPAELNDPRDDEMRAAVQRMAEQQSGTAGARAKAAPAAKRASRKRAA